MTEIQGKSILVRITVIIAIVRYFVDRMRGNQGHQASETGVH